MARLRYEESKKARIRNVRDLLKKATGWKVAPNTVSLESHAFYRLSSSKHPGKTVCLFVNDRLDTGKMDTFYRAMFPVIVVHPLGQRKRRDPEKERFWREVIRRQRKSSLTVSAFCAAEGLKDWSFHWWRRELAKRDREKSATKPKDVPSFVPVQLVPERVEQHNTSTIEVVLTSGQRVRIPSGFDPQALDSLLTVLESHRC